MSTQPQDKLSTADMAAPASRAPHPDDGKAPAADVAARKEHSRALLAGNEAHDLRTRWESVQVGFVDEPRRAVQEADSLVAQTMKRVAEVFADERAGLERQWSEGQDVSTEDLRVALTRYRSFFDRLLSV
jgi:hypothetical protein